MQISKEPFCLIPPFTPACVPGDRFPSIGLVVQFPRKLLPYSSNLCATRTDRSGIFSSKFVRWLGSGRELPDAEGDLLCVAPPPPGAVQGGHHVDHEDQHHLQVHRVQIWGMQTIKERKKIYRTGVPIKYVPLLSSVVDPNKLNLDQYPELAKDPDSG